MPSQTPSQTVGPFFHDALFHGAENRLVDEHTAGERIYIQGQVLDGDGQPVTDALVEIWQADARGFFNHPADPNQAQADPFFRGFGRSDTVDDGLFWFQTIKPGPVTTPGQQDQAPHINLRLFARGMLVHVVTRLYFSDERANERDPVLSMVEAERRPTLIAERQLSEVPACYQFDIWLQGPNETVFFDL